ncbi:hypothetical protein [Metaclostridioides mangenotii]|uniref:hypothetical protein n=1 Tax=Metaclostridioides mangenotii TaxID=1540 RepID=UPI0026F058F9|nr:hypothetical protein [Clostridioides mangenotii]
MKARKDLINNTKDYYPDISLKGREELTKQYGLIEPLFVDLVIGEANFLSKLRDGNGE